MSTLRAAILAHCAGALMMGLACSAQAGDGMVFTGVTEAVRDLALSLSVDGVVRELKVAEGTAVKAGAPLLHLDDRLEEYEVKRRALIVENHATLEASRQKRGIVESMLKSSRALHQKSGTVSAEQVQQLEMSYHDVVGTIRSLEGEKAREKVEYEIARTQLERRTLVSPISGIVTVIDVDVGERVRGGEPIVRVVDLSSCYLIANIEETYARRLKSGTRHTVDVRVGDEWVSRQAEVTFVSPVADPASSLVKVKLKIPNETGDIRPGMPGRIAFAGSGL